jgi:glycosyltransferase involved in cell wall biosynthesis
MNDQKNSEKPFVSIIVPVYNVERYLRQCLDSIIRQTLNNIEIIIVNDGSTDSCPAICNDYAEQDKRIQVIHRQNGGYGKTCNAGFDAANGEYLNIIEPDDFIEPAMMERLYNMAKLHNLDIARCNFFKYNSGEDTRMIYINSRITKDMVFSPLDNPYVFCQQHAIWTMIYRAGLIRKYNIRFLETPGASYQDTSFTFKAYACADRFMLIEDALVHYRTDNQNSSCNSKEKVFCICEEYAEIENFAKKKGMYENLISIIVKTKCSGYIWNYKRLGKKNRWRFLKVFAREMRNHISQKHLNKIHFAKPEYSRVYKIAYLYLLYHLKHCVLGKRKQKLAATG